MTVTIEELERMCAAGGSIRKVAKEIGVTHQCVSARLIRSRETRDFIASLNKGDMLREKMTGHRWQYMGLSARSADSVRVATEGGAHQMDMSVSSLERVKHEEKPEEKSDLEAPVVLFSLSRGDDPNDPRFRGHIERAMEVRRVLDEQKQAAMKADPVSHLIATTKRKAEAKKQLAE